MHRLVDDVLAVAKESVKTITYESLNNMVRLINGVSALMLAVIPGKSSILEGIHGWELRPTIRGPRFPRWMEKGVSSFNHFIHDLSVDSDASSLEYTSADKDSDDDIYHASPSQFSGVPTGSALVGHDRDWIQYMFFWILFPIKLLLGFPDQLLRSYFVGSGAPPKPGSPHSVRRMQTLKDQIVHRATDRRRGLVEDLHLLIEITIEAIFDAFCKAAHLLLSPSDILRAITGLFSSPGRVTNNEHGSNLGASVDTDTLGENDPAIPKRNTRFYQSMNTDSRTCQDVITELGYPYEAIHVITSDGYVLLLERIPRRDAQKAVYLQHGVFDSSMGWVSNGVVGSPAFAAYNQGYDVFLGNFRGLVSREHVERNISSQKYWNYSLNELGTKDIPAMIDKIHEVKTTELKLLQPDLGEEIYEDQPYKLCAICHSLGGAATLIYVITRRIKEKPHRLARLILLSPAGFHYDSSMVFTFMEHFLILLAPILRPFVPGIYIPTRFFRMLLNKLARDFHNLPAVGGLVQTFVSYIVGGDASNWVGILGLPHYNMYDMPGVSFNSALHLAQIKHIGKFRMFDYGSAAANMDMYGSPEPVDLAECYGLIDIPVDLVAGRKDKVIRPSMIRKHYEVMKLFGVDVTYNEFEYAHLDFTFSHREELLAYVMSRLLLVDPASMPQASQRRARLEKKGQVTG